MLNKHGLKIVGVKKLVSEAKSCLPDGKSRFDGRYLQVNYDTQTGEVWADFLVDIGGNSRRVYHDENVITICNYGARNFTMQDVCDSIKFALDNTPMY